MGYNPPRCPNRQIVPRLSGSTAAPPAPSLPSWPHVFPWFIPAILTASTTAAGAAYGMPRLSPVAVGLANAHFWALLGMVLLAVGMGYGQDKR